jgi:alpha-ketoglutarate-dependent taurine dioxygenase
VRVVHSVTAAVREVASPEEHRAGVKRGFSQEQPLVWTTSRGAKSLLIATPATLSLAVEGARARAAGRLLEWTAQPDFTYRHQWQEGDLVVWDNCGALHRVVPYCGGFRPDHAPHVGRRPWRR